MSNTKAFIDYAVQDNGSAAREALYAEIHDRVMSHIEAKKMELAGGMLHAEEKSCDMNKDDIKSQMKKTSKKIGKLKEEIAILEDYLSYILSEETEKEDDDADAEDVKSELEHKKKKLSKKEKKMCKLKEAYALLEGDEDGVDETGEWEDEESEDDSDEN